jgi:hypothetical protein
MVQASNYTYKWTRVTPYLDSSIITLKPQYSEVSMYGRHVHNWTTNSADVN